MGTYKEESQEEQQEAQDPSVIAEENLITGPPASRTVIDNLKKLLVQRQCSRESDYENKNRVTQSTSGSNSDAAFYSQFSTSSSDSDSESDSNFIFEDISNQENRKGTGRRRPHRRQRSYSSSSSSSRSPVEKRRRKPASKIKPAALAGSDDNARQFPPETSKSSLICTTSTPTGGSHHEVDSANSTSSHKDSSTEDENNAVQRLNDGETGGGSKLLKLQSRRDRNRKRKRSQTNYANHGPNNAPGYQLIPKIVISPSDNDVHSVETESNTNSNNIPPTNTPEKITNQYSNPELSTGTDQKVEDKTATGEIIGEEHNDNNIK